MIKGLTVDKVTCDFPLVDVDKAVSEVKRDKPGNRVLQKCRVPQLAGGVTDVLLGIHYSLVHPDPVHTLESGLTIYRSKLVGHHKGFNAMIGGPHSSFDCLSNQAGGVAQMVANFVLGLERYKAGEWSAPRVPRIDMEDEEIQFAKKMNASSSELPILSEIAATEAEEEKLTESFQAVLDSLAEHCNHQVGKGTEHPHMTPGSSSIPICVPASESFPICAPAGDSFPICAPNR